MIFSAPDAALLLSSSETLDNVALYID